MLDAPIVLTNDDGVDAPGIDAFRRALDGAVVTIAPHEACSGCGHRITDFGAVPVERRAENVYAVVGTPADCVRLAIHELCPEVKWVVSGINRGGNLGADVYPSGTVAAVREGAFYRIPGIAVSQFVEKDRDVDWERSVAWTRRVIERLSEETLEPGAFWNVNLPHLRPGDDEPEIVFCKSCTQPLHVAYRTEGDVYHYAGNYPDRIYDPNSDVAVCFAGDIAVTRLFVAADA